MRRDQAPPPLAITEVLGALDSSPVGHYVLECRTVSRGSLLEVADPEAGLLEALLILAKDHDLAVYDIGLNRLYDPGRRRGRRRGPARCAAAVSRPGNCWRTWCGGRRGPTPRRRT